MEFANCLGFGGGFQFPEAPADLEFVGVVFVEQLEGFFDGEAGIGAALATTVDALEDGRLGPADGPDGGGIDAGLAAVGCELTEDRGQLGGKRFEAQIRVPET